MVGKLQGTECELLLTDLKNVKGSHFNLFREISRLAQPILMRFSEVFVTLGFSILPTFNVLNNIINTHIGIYEILNILTNTLATRQKGSCERPKWLGTTELELGNISIFRKHLPDALKRSVTHYLYLLDLQVLITKI